MTTTTKEQSIVDETQLRLGIPDVYSVAQALDSAIKRKVFNENEIKEIYGPWSRVIRFCEDIKRKTEVEQLYTEKTEEEVPVEHVEVGE